MQIFLVAVTHNVRQPDISGSFITGRDRATTVTTSTSFHKIVWPTLSTECLLRAEQTFFPKTNYLTKMDIDYEKVSKRNGPSLIPIIGGLTYNC